MNRTFRHALAAVLMTTLPAAAANPGPGEAGAADRALVEAIAADDVGAARAALDVGASPDAWTGIEPDEMAVCNATRLGREELLELLIARGADVDRQYVEAPLDYGAPLACAIVFGNRAAFDRLLEAGASPDRSLCPDCLNASLDTDVLTTAAIAQEYGMMMRLLELTPPSEGGLFNVVYTIERRRPPTDPDAARDRQAVIDWLRANGHAVEPREG